MAQTTQKALLVTQKGGTFEHLSLVRDWPVPSPAADQVLVKVHTAGLNPVDKVQTRFGIFTKSFPAVLGCEFSGVVESVGSNVQKFKKGDVVTGYNRLDQETGGSYEEYVLIEASVLVPKPSGFSLEQAAAFSLGILTSGTALFRGLKIPYPSHKLESKEYILITGGAGYVASYGIQLAVLSGLTVITTASPAHFDNLKKLGATHVIDRSADLPAEVAKITPNLRYAYDTIGPETAEAAANALSKDGPAFLATVVGKPKTLPPNVTVAEIAVARYTPEDVATFEQIWKEIWPLAESGKIVPFPVEVLPKGLNGVTQGMQTQFSGKKPVIRIEETE